MTYITCANPSGSVVNHAGGLVINRSMRIPNDAVVEKLGVYSSARTVSLKICKMNSAGNFDIVATQSFAHPGGGFADVTLTTPYTVPSTGDYYVGYFCPSGSINYTSSIARSSIFPASEPMLGNITGLADNTGTTGAVRAYLSDGGTPPVDPPVTDPVETFELFGVIRNSGSGWAFIDNSDHKPLNFGTISTGSTYIRIPYTQTASKVGTFVITPDETYAQSGYTAGASVGLSYADVYFGHNGVAVTPAAAASSTGNFWVYGKMWK